MTFKFNLTKRIAATNFALILCTLSILQTEDSNVLQLGKKSQINGSFLYSNVVGYPIPQYAIIPIDSDADIEAVANNGWVLLDDRVRWKWGDEEELQAPPSGSCYISDMNNSGDVIGHGGGGHALLWKHDSSIVTLLPATT
jgi:hypothetical protein